MFLWKETATSPSTNKKSSERPKGIPGTYLLKPAMKNEQTMVAWKSKVGFLKLATRKTNVGGKRTSNKPTWTLPTETSQAEMTNRLINNR